MGKIIIYQVFTRLFGNDNTNCQKNGDIHTNGCGKMADFTPKALEQIRSLGCTHIWYTGLIEHATQSDYSEYGIPVDCSELVKGKAGSPYAIKDYYDIDPDLAVRVPKRMHEFEQLVARTHRARLKVIMDFVPNHVARQYHSDAANKDVHDLGADDDCSLEFSTRNNFYYLNEPFSMEGISSYTECPAKATGNDAFCAHPSHNDWYETVKLNYGIDVCHGRSTHFQPIPDTWEKMRDILLFWASKGIDGFRCDMAEMVPVDFWEWVIPQVKEKHPDLIFIAEVYNPLEYRSYLHKGHFDYLYDKVGLYDTLRAVICGWKSTQDLTLCWQWVDDIRDQMLYFLENHDEQRLASDFFAGNARKGKAALMTAVMMGKNPIMLYAGQELGERGMEEEGFSGRDGRTTIFDYWHIDTLQRWRNGGAYDGGRLTNEEQELQTFYRNILNLCHTCPTLAEGDFYDLMYVNPQLNRQYAFLRHLKGETIVVVANFEEEETEIDLNIPAHVFSLYQLKENEEADTIDLLTRKAGKTAFTSTYPCHLRIPASEGLILSVKTSK